MGKRHKATRARGYQLVYEAGDTGERLFTFTTNRYMVVVGRWCIRIYKGV